MNAVQRAARAWTGLSVAVQQSLAFAAVLVLTAAIGVVGLLSLQRVGQEADELSDKWLPAAGHLASLRAAVIEVRDQEVRHSRTDDRSYHAEYEDKMAEAAQRADKALKAHVAQVSAEDEKKLVASFEKAWKAYQDSRQRVVQLGRSGQQQDAADISDGLSASLADDTLASIEKMWAYNSAGGAAVSRDAAATQLRATRVMLGLLAAAITLGVVLATLFVRSLRRQLGGEPADAVAIARGIAAGDLSRPVPVRPGDSDSLFAQLRQMQTALATAVRTVRHTSDSVATASSQIAAGNQDMSDRTERQASALQQTAATMDELGATVRHTAENAREAHGYATEASQRAGAGSEIVGAVVQTMQGIHDASRQIADIIGVIDGIAFQTNILALNAAVEAARAGSQGRGFAVVAGEVRNLAQRCAEAAREVRSLINTNVERVEQGSALVEKAGQTMEEIVRSIGRVTAVVGDISNASREQSEGVQQVGQAVSQMDQSTQQSAALVEQSAAAATSLAEQARQLVAAVAVFRLETGSTRT